MKIINLIQRFLRWTLDYGKSISVVNLIKGWFPCQRDHFELVTINFLLVPLCIAMLHPHQIRSSITQQQMSIKSEIACSKKQAAWTIQSDQACYLILDNLIYFKYQLRSLLFVLSLSRCVYIYIYRHVHLFYQRFRLTVKAYSSL